MVAVLEMEAVAVLVAVLIVVAAVIAVEAVAVVVDAVDDLKTKFNTTRVLI